MAAAEVAAAYESMGEMMNAGNAEGVVDLYTADCRVLSPGDPPVLGKEALLKLIEEYIAKGYKGGITTTEEMQSGADDIAEGGTFWEKGIYKFFKEGDAIFETGKYVVIWKKVSGKLKLDVEIWNTTDQ